MANPIENGESSSGKAGAKSGVWSEQEKYSLLLQVVKQFAGTSNPKWDQIDLPGRTTKSLQHAWAKIKSEVAEFADAPAGDAAGTLVEPKKRAVSGKRKTKAADVDSDGEADDIAPTSAKKPKTNTSKKNATLKKPAAATKKGKKSDTVSNGVAANNDTDDEAEKKVIIKTTVVAKKGKKSNSIVATNEANDKVEEEKVKEASSVDAQIESEASAYSQEI